ncbi:FGGY family carbohydrate kinase, partial [Pseudomonas faucium]|uniref:FGGY family carbohydrate kinase n=1 Tax=Pseudomonas faucium TaxID=2740518 RepID=UPI0015964ED2
MSFVSGFALAASGRLRAIIFDRDANVVGTSQREFAQHYPQAGWVEHDPMEIFATQSATMV